MASINSTADTLSVRFKPGRDLRNFPVASQSIFTFGNFRIEKDGNTNFLTADTRNLNFGGYQTLSSLNISGSTTKNTFVHSNELNFKRDEIDNHVYFGSMKMEVAAAINNIKENWPFAIASKSFAGTGATIYNYSSITTVASANTSSFRVPFSSITNQGNVIMNSGSTRLGRSLMTDTNDFVVQLNGASGEYPIHPILNYSFSAGNYLDFTVSGTLLTGQTTGESTVNLYIRPKDNIIYNFKKSLPPLEHHLVYNGLFQRPNPYYDDGSTIPTTYTWPKNIDGFNLDMYGALYETYETSILNFAHDMDCEKTDILIRHVIPENYLELDTDTEIYRNMVQAYAHEFDAIKKYIDGIAYAHTVTYDGTNNVPDKFMFKLSELLGLKLPANFSELDLFGYLANDYDLSGNTKHHYNLQTWRRVLTNITWLFKRKGTRDALMFIFRLIGAPDCLIRLNEFVYDIEKSLDVVQTEFSADTQVLSNSELNAKVNDHGFVNYTESQYIFQEGGRRRGNGRRYIDQWEPEFDPLIRADNVKVQTGDTVFFGTENIINTKELDCALDPAQAIEWDVHDFYQLSGTCWVWGSEDPFAFENLNVPFEYVIENCETVSPAFISGVTFNEYIDFIYKSNVNPTNRKTATGKHTSFHYPELRRIYLNYFYITDPVSNRLAFGKLERFLELIEQSFFCYTQQLIPATSILNIYGTVYRNTVFNRQRFVYKQGINAGSEFQVAAIQDPAVSGITVTMTETFDDIQSDAISAMIFSGTVITSLEPSLLGATIEMTVVDLLEDTIESHDIELIYNDTVTEEEEVAIEITQ